MVNMWNKYEWNNGNKNLLVWFYYHDVLIKNIVLVEYKIIQLTLCFSWSPPKISNNEAYDFQRSIFEIKINYTLETKYY